MGLTFNLGRISPSVFTDSSLNVGIGAAPSGTYKLEVTGTGRFTSTLLVGGASTFNSSITLSTASTSYGSVFSIANTSNSKQWNFTTVGSGIAGRTGNLEINNNVADIFAITQAGNVGIGLTNPTNTFVVKPSGATNSIVIGSIAATATYGMISLNGTNLEGQYVGLAGGGGVDVSLYYQSGNGGDHIFRTGNGTTFTERMRITSGGDVCVGTTTASLPSSGRANITIGGSANSLLAFKVAGTGTGYLYHGGAQMYLENSVVGGALYVNSGASGGVYLASGATAWAANSDERLKNIHSNIENAVESLMTLRTVKHSWKSDDTNKEYLALIAQDVEKVFPQVIDINKLPNSPSSPSKDETEYLGVRYTELIPVLVKAIQELSAQNQDLKSRLDKAGL